jgi:hypothetical protein
MDHKITHTIYFQHDQALSQGRDDKIGLRQVDISPILPSSRWSSPRWTTHFWAQNSGWAISRLCTQARDGRESFAMDGKLRSIGFRTAVTGDYGLP